ncbi:hypothetical protein PG989_011856 [Apiospora arundinis]
MSDTMDSDMRLLMRIIEENQPGLSVLGWETIAAKEGINIATAKQKYGALKKKWAKANVDFTAAAPAIKPRNRGNKRKAAGDDEINNDGDDVTSPSVSVPASLSSQAAVSAPTVTTTATGNPIVSSPAAPPSPATQESSAVQAATAAPAAPASDRRTRSQSQAQYAVAPAYYSPPATTLDNQRGSTSKKANEELSFTKWTKDKRRERREEQDRQRQEEQLQRQERRRQMVEDRRQLEEDQQYAASRV